MILNAIRHEERHGTRSAQTTTILNDYVDWPYLGQVFRSDRHVTILDGSNPRDEVAFGITDLSPEQADAEQNWSARTRTLGD